MGLGFEIELRGREVAADFDVVVGGAADGDGFMGDVGDAGEELLELVDRPSATSLSRAAI